MMNSVSPTSPSQMPFVPVAPDDAPAAGDGPAGFAKALDRAAQAADRHAERPPDHRVRDDAEPDTPDAVGRAARGKRPQRTPATQPREGADPQVKGPAEEVLSQAESKAASQTQGDTQSDAAAQALLDLAGLMAGLTQATTRGTATTADAAHGGAQDDAATAASRASAQQRSGKAATQADVALTQDQDLLLAARQGIESRTLAPGDAVAAATVLRDSGAARQVFDNAVGSPLAQAAGAAPPAASPTPAGEPAAMFRAELTAALGTPEFASALGAQVSVLIRGGVSQAQLHLNPADMGPIAVHIRLDGDNAQVDFSALQALTRQALEDAVPALASALRESGLTLSGGGVFEQARQPQSERHGSRADGAHRTSSHAADAAPTHGAVVSAFRARGMVDLYA